MNQTNGQLILTVLMDYVGDQELHTLAQVSKTCKVDAAMLLPQRKKDFELRVHMHSAIEQLTRFDGGSWDLYMTVEGLLAAQRKKRRRNVATLDSALDWRKSLKPMRSYYEKFF